MQGNSEDSSGKAAVRSYAIRRVNPFLGVLQVIESPAGRAVSTNGVVWDIEVKANRGGGWGSLDGDSGQVAFYRYGLWSEADGLVRRPLAPHLDNDPLTRQCNALIECVRSHMEKIPFDLADSRELWLFDSTDSRPLALLATAMPDSILPSPEPRVWSASIGANGIPSQRRYPRSGELEAMIRKAAGFNIHKHWIRRQDDGSGVIEARNIRLGAERFPAYLLSEDWSDEEQRRLVSGYFEWISPSLLTLQRLDRKERVCMENSLTVQAISLEHHWRLYPEVIDKAAIQAARVQCRREKTHPGGEES